VPDDKFNEQGEMEREREKMERGKSELRMAMEELCLLSSRDVEDQQQDQDKKQQQRSSTMDLLYVSKQLLHVLGWLSTQYPIGFKISSCLFPLLFITNESSIRLSCFFLFDSKIKRLGCSRIFLVVSICLTIFL
jgi:hypothetical protein